MSDIQQRIEEAGESYKEEAVTANGYTFERRDPTLGMLLEAIKVISELEERVRRLEDRCCCEPLRYSKNCKKPH